MGYRIFLSPPNITPKAHLTAQTVINSGWLSAKAPVVHDLETCAASWFGDSYFAVAVQSGTAALHLALHHSGVRDGDKVACPTTTFVACANAIRYCGAEPVFIDVNPDTWTLCPDSLARAMQEVRFRAVLAVDLYGCPADYDRLLPLCRAHGASLIEDAAEALGGKYRKQKLGGCGDLGVLSFNVNKVITGGQGGMVLTRDAKSAENLRHLSSQARSPTDADVYDEVGFNYGMPAIPASILYSQWSELEARVARRRDLNQKYRAALAATPGVHVLPTDSEHENSHWLTAVRLDPRFFPAGPGAVVKAFGREGIETRRIWKPLHTQPPYSKNPFFSADSAWGSVAESAFGVGLCLPSGEKLADAELEEVVQRLQGLAASPVTA